MLKIIFTGVIILAGLSFSISAQDKTIVSDAGAKKMLLGKHLFSLQWISWDYFGAATVTDKKGVLYLKGEQKQRGGTDFVKIDGTIISIDKKEFVFDGTIVTQISYLNNGETCTRTGEMTFAATGKRKYWRLQAIDNPCDEAADYVDIYFR
ncbi:MAG: hypothetical protein LH614_17555 [Pyrinomonadaceae bacterium]|nr:hypothetical protein [Pyrinomonadaceae bacterium]